VFVRGGAFIPTVEPVQSTSDYPNQDIMLTYYFDDAVKESNGFLYDDDGITPDAYAKGQYEILNFSSRLLDKGVEITVTSAPEENYPGQDRQMDLQVINIPEEPSDVQNGGEDVCFSWNPDRKSINTHFTLPAKGVTIITISWK
ncbi:MAG: DUF5110 domain-containing protein, partial [Bacteroidetes bacterium]|nr:DUF5110 domain-containing protein [Bacteroidota bacterium]